MKRRKSTIEFVKKRRSDNEKRRRRKREILEAYVDEKGELRVRTVKRYFEDEENNSGEEEAIKTKNKCEMLKEKMDEDEQSVDVSAKEYIDAVKVGQDIEFAKSNKCLKATESVIPNEEQMKLIALTKHQNHSSNFIFRRSFRWFSVGWICPSIN